MNFNFVSKPVRWTGVALLSLSFGLSGCGGGGGNSGGGTGPNIVTSRPPATPTDGTATNNRCTNTTYTPNYTDDVELLRWRLFPLRVYFKRNSNYSAARQALAIEGFNRWVTATGNNGFTYRAVNKESDSNITVDFYRFNGGAGDTLGTTVISYFKDSRTIDSADISLGITGDRNNDLLTATHEMGHALGIFGHSSNSTDLMFFEGNERSGGNITQFDLNTVLTIYCGDFNKNPNNRVAAHNGELKTVTIN